MFISQGIIHAYVTYARLFSWGFIFSYIIYACFISIYMYDVNFTHDFYFVFYYALARESATFVVLRHFCTFCTVYTCTIGRILAVG